METVINRNLNKLKFFDHIETVLKMLPKVDSAIIEINYEGILAIIKPYSN